MVLLAVAVEATAVLVLVLMVAVLGPRTRLRPRLMLSPLAAGSAPSRGLSFVSEVAGWSLGI